MSDFTHFDGNGNAVMVDVSQKEDTVREARAVGTIKLSEYAYNKVVDGSIGKGDVLGIARVAGIMGAKKTSDLIPLCHILNLSKVTIDFQLNEENFSIKAFCTVKTIGKTGVEMEALTGVNIALLTIYDMCKALGKEMEITDIMLLKKTGGKSGTWER